MSVPQSVDGFDTNYPAVILTFAESGGKPRNRGESTYYGSSKITVFLSLSHKNHSLRPNVKKKTEKKPKLGECDVISYFYFRK